MVVGRAPPRRRYDAVAGVAARRRRPAPATDRAGRGPRARRRPARAGPPARAAAPRRDRPAPGVRRARRPRAAPVRSGPRAGPAAAALAGDDRPRRVGAPPTDPADVPADELARVGVGLLAELLGRRAGPARRGDPDGPPTPVEQGVPPRRRPGHDRRRTQRAGGRRPRRGRPPPRGGAARRAARRDARQVWSTRVQRGAPVRWATFVGRWARRDQLPPSADLATHRRLWAGRVGPERVHVVAGPDARRTTAEILGLRTADPVAPARPAQPLPRRASTCCAGSTGCSTCGSPSDVARARTCGTSPGCCPRTRPRPWTSRAGTGPGSTSRAAPGRRRPPRRRLRCARRPGRARPPPRGRPHPRRDDVLALVLDTCLRVAELETLTGTGGAPQVARRVLVHVGAPKTGTSFVQDLLFSNRGALAEQGILYPADRFDAHFLAALDLMELHWGGLEKQAVGAWDRLRRAGPRLAGHRDHLPRDPRHRLAGAGAPRARVVRRRRRGARRALRARPGPADPRRVAGERQAPPDRRLPRRQVSSTA